MYAVICGGYRCLLPGYYAFRFIGKNGISHPEGGLWTPDFTWARFYNPTKVRE